MNPRETLQIQNPRVAFAERYKALLRSLGETRAIHLGEMAFELLIIGEGQERGAIVGLSDLQQQYEQALPAQREAVLLEHARFAWRTVQEKYDVIPFAEARPRLLPMLHHRSYFALRALEYMSWGGEVRSASDNAIDDVIVHQHWLTDIDIVICECFENGARRHISMGDLRHWSIDVATAVNIALENVGKLPLQIIQRDRRATMITQDATVIAGMMLDARYHPQFKNCTVIPMSTYDLLLVLEPTAAELAKLASGLLKFDLMSGESLSFEALQLGKEGWQPYAVARNAAPAYYDLRRKAQVVRYEKQTRFLERYLARGREPNTEEVFVPAVEMQQTKDGQRWLTTNWPSGMAMLLPEVDLINFFEPGKEARWVRFDDLLQHCPQLLEKTAYQPPRWRTRGYPDAELIQRLQIKN